MDADTFWLYKDFVRIALIFVGVIFILPSIQLIYEIGISREALLSERLEQTTQGSLASRLTSRWVYFGEDNRGLFAMISVMAFVYALLLDTF